MTIQKDRAIELITNDLTNSRDLENTKQETVSIPSSSLLSSPVFLMSVLANIASGGYFLYSSLAVRRDRNGQNTGNIGSLLFRHFPFLSLLILTIMTDGIELSTIDHVTGKTSTYLYHYLKGFYQQ